jgi:undecaprenyl-diphosphatase
MADPTCAQAPLGTTSEVGLDRRPSQRPWYVAAFVAVLLAYAALTLTVLIDSPILSLDSYVFGLHIGGHNPQWAPLINVLVIAGQRGPTTLIALPWFAWRAWRQRSLRPLVLLASALVLLYLSVGAVKLATGRIGPRHTVLVDDFFNGGNIFPSGHVSNAVVLFGLLAWIAVRHRRAMVALAVFVPMMVGACTIYLRTHWVSDIVAGWFAGGLVLMALPWVMPGAERCVDATIRGLARWTRRPQLRLLTANLASGAAAATASAAPAPAVRHAQPRPRSQVLRKQAPRRQPADTPARLVDARTADHS